MSDSTTLPIDGLVVVLNYVWDGAQRTKNQSIHYFPAAWGGVTEQPVLIVNMIPSRQALTHPRQRWHFRPGLHQTASENVHVLNIWQDDWRELAHLGRPLPAEAAARGIRSAARRLRMAQPALMVSEPAHGALIGKCGECCSLWFCTDDFAAGDLRRAESIRRSEQLLLPVVDLVLTVSPTLEAKWRPMAKRVLLTPNAVDAEELVGLAAQTSSIQGWPQGWTPRPCTVYLGSLNERVDYAGLNDAVRKRPDVTFLFVGPTPADAATSDYSEALAQLRSAPNTHYLGRRDRREVAWILSQCDVGLIPYLDNDFNLNCSPLKVYEYSALGLPTIATPLPSIGLLGRDVCLAAPARLADVLGEVLADLPKWREHAHALLDNNTWQDRVRQVQGKLMEMATKK